MGRGNDEAVARALNEPLFERIADLFRAADDGIVHAAASAMVHELPDRRIFITTSPHDAVADGLQAGNCRHLFVGECLVHPFGRGVEVERFREKRERVDLERQLIDEGPFVFGLHPTRSGHGADQVRDLDLLGVAAAAGHLRLKSRVVALADGNVRVDDEDQLAPLRPEALATTALAGLDDDRTPLRGARHGERPA